MAHQWVNKGGFIYRLRDNGRYRNGVAEVENEYHMNIYGAKGLTESDVTVLAEKIVNLLNNADTDTGKTQYIIEFRNGSYFQDISATNGGAKETAQRFNSRESTERFMDVHPWIYANGGMVVEVQS